MGHGFWPVRASLLRSTNRVLNVLEPGSWAYDANQVRSAVQAKSVCFVGLT